ncbi:MAG TPA: hypothetical protein VG916_02725 [Gemmatimonadaceae bacterium]|nr:hypothetical protein [Gemmatimonadaceae bacterium]
MMSGLYNPPLQVVGFVGTKTGDADRGPEVRMQAWEAHLRGLADGDIAWVYGPRRHDLARVRVDESVARGEVVARDIAGLAVSEIVRLVRVDADRDIINAPPAKPRKRS